MNLNNNNISTIVGPSSLVHDGATMPGSGPFDTDTISQQTTEPEQVFCEKSLVAGTMRYGFSPFTGLWEFFSNILAYSLFLYICLNTMMEVFDTKYDNNNDFNILSTKNIFIALYATLIASNVSFARYRQYVKNHEEPVIDSEMRSMLSISTTQTINVTEDADIEEQNIAASIYTYRLGKLKIKLTNGLIDFFVWQGEAFELASPIVSLLGTLPETRGLSATTNLLCQLGAFLAASVPATATTASLHGVIKSWLSDKEVNAPTWLEKLESSAATVKTLMDFISNILFSEALGHMLANRFVTSPLSLSGSISIFSASTAISLFASVPNGYAEKKLLLNPVPPSISREFGWINSFAIAGIFLQNTFSFSQNFVSAIIKAGFPLITIPVCMFLAQVASIAPTVLRANALDIPSSDASGSSSLDENTPTTITDKCLSFFSGFKRGGYRAHTDVSVERHDGYEVTVYDFSNQ